MSMPNLFAVIERRLDRIESKLDIINYPKYLNKSVSPIKINHPISAQRRGDVPFGE